MIRRTWLGAVIVLVGLMTACQSPEAATELGPPEGWIVEGDRWWQPGVDTSRAFRPLGSLDDMGIANEIVYASSVSDAARSSMRFSQFERAIKQSLIRLYRNEPAVVDSLFERFVTPKLRAADLDRDIDEQIKAYKTTAYRTLSRHFREPHTLLSMGPGQDVPVVYPDSLRSKRLSGSVRMQVFIDEEGTPLAIELLEGLHPTLDASAMRATTQMRWQPAYLLQGGSAKPLPAWARFNVSFRVPGAS